MSIETYSGGLDSPLETPLHPTVPEHFEAGFGGALPLLEMVATSRDELYGRLPSLTEDGPETRFRMYAGAKPRRYTRMPEARVGLELRTDETVTRAYIAVRRLEKGHAYRVMVADDDTLDGRRIPTEDEMLDVTAAVARLGKAYAEQLPEIAAANKPRPRVFRNAVARLLGKSVAVDAEA